MDMDKIKEEYFTFEGRINRKVYLIRFLILFSVSFILGLLLGVLGISREGIINIIIGVILTAAAFSLHIKRLHDLGKNAWWCLLIFVPIVNLGLLIYMMCFKGVEVTNEYGPNPLADEFYS